MDWNEYQNGTLRTFNPKQSGRDRLANFALGIAGEAGEVAELVKKHLFHGHPLDLEKAEKELGDVLWYLAALANCLGLTLEGAAVKNMEKLRTRFPEGFSSAASLARVDVSPDGSRIKAGQIREEPDGFRWRMVEPESIGWRIAAIESGDKAWTPTEIIETWKLLVEAEEEGDDDGNG